MKALLIDFESTGLDTATARITEVGGQVVDENYKVLSTISTLVYEPGYPEITPEVTKVTGITQEQLEKNGVPFFEALKMLHDSIGGVVNYVVAHNAAYDEPLFRAEVLRHDMDMYPIANWLMSTPWLCSMVDIESNYQFKSWRLAHLALEYGVTVNPKELHRAINDVDLMRQMLEASGVTFEQMLEYKQSPWVYVVALTKAPWEDNGKSTGNAKALGFSWQQAKGDDTGRVFDKRWVKRIKQKDWPALEANLLVQVRLL